MTTTQRTLTNCELYWDTQDPNDEGWAYRIAYSVGYESSGCWERLGRNPTSEQLRNCVVELAHQLGREISPDQVHCEPATDGGVATWDG
jgi:hypothetical protein